MDVERFTLTYATAHDLMRDLKAIGAHNANAGRPRGLTGKGALARMTAAYEALRRDGRLPATYEVVYGQAWSPVATPRGSRAPGEVVVPIGKIGRRGAGRGAGAGDP
jgi:malonyl-CoA O-methyltransferase